MRAAPFRPFASRGRGTIAAILLTFALSSAVGVTVSIVTTSKSKHQAAVVEVAARQRTLVDRYVKDVLLARSGVHVDPDRDAALLTRTAAVLLDGGEVPAVDGDDDDARLTPAKGAVVRRQLEQGRRLAEDLRATGRALLAGSPADSVRLTADEHVKVADPLVRLRILAALSSNVSLNTVRTLATGTDRNIGDLIEIQVVLGIAGLATSLLLAFALIATTRRQTAHFRSLVTSSTDLVLVFGPDGCRYASASVTEMLGAGADAVLGNGLDEVIHPDDLAAVRAATTRGEPHEIVFRVRNRFDEWRHLEAHVTDLRDERHIRGIVLNARDISEHVRLEEQLTQQAFHDALTALPNRALFRDRLDQALARSQRSREVLAVLLFDLDGFKQVNDTLGHDAGDKLLQEIGRRLEAITRPSDTVARLGGDEFALLLEGADEALATTIAARMLDSLGEPVSIAGRELSLSASVGIVLHPGGEAQSEDLVRHADVAMYAAKEAGRGRYEIFRYEMARQVGELLGLEHEMRLGIQRGEFVLHYQPEISVDTSEVVGVEALLRWTSPARGAVPPARFIPVAEATGLIQPIGELVLREACAQGAAWRAAGLLPETFTVWVNVSPKQLSAGGFEELVRSVLAETGLPPTLLGIEVTESAIVDDGIVGERSRGELQALRDLGVCVAIDDFGTGFSSLGQLRRMPVDMIKVDRSFIEGVEHNARDAAITSNLVSLAHALGLVATAEGIESAGQLASLRNLGCDLAQGFLFARPMPAAELGALLEHGFPAADDQAA